MSADLKLLNGFEQWFTTNQVELQSAFDGEKETWNQTHSDPFPFDDAEGLAAEIFIARN